MKQLRSVRRSGSDGVRAAGAHSALFWVWPFGQGHSEVIDVLLRADADTEARNKAGKTAEDLSKTGKIRQQVKAGKPPPPPPPAPAPAPAPQDAPQGPLPPPPPIGEGMFHVFLSHDWGAADELGCGSPPRLCCAARTAIIAPQPIACRVHL